MTDYIGVEQFPRREEEHTVTNEVSLAEYYHEKIDRSHSWYWKEWYRITGLADFSEADWGEAPKH